MASRSLKNAVATAGDDLDPAHFLGRLTMFTLPDEERNSAKLVRAWAKHGLDVADLPDARQPVHVFQSACASVKTRKAGTGRDGKVEIAADEVEHNGVCTYQVTRRVWDLANRSIEHEKAIRVTFDKATSDLTFERLHAGKDKAMDQIEGAIKANFDANAKTLPGQKIRNAVRHTLLKIGAQNMRRKAGGVYFVPREWRPNGKAKPTKPVLDGLAGVLEELYGDRADFHQIPLISGDAEKRMVAKHFALNVREKAEELTAKAINRVRAGRGERGVRAEMLTNLWNERRRLSQQVAQFEELVSVETQDLETYLQTLDGAITQLQDMADNPDA